MNEPSHGNCGRCGECLACGGGENWWIVSVARQNLTPSITSDLLCDHCVRDIWSEITRPVKRTGFKLPAHPELTARLR